MKSRYIASIASFVTLSVSSLAQAEEAKAAGGHGAGTLELRIQTASTVAGGGIFGLITAPGVVYAPDSEIFILNLIGGAGYFVTPSLALGGDLGFTRIDGNGEASIITLAPFVKFVTGLPEHTTGFFVEASPGIVLVDGSGIQGTSFIQLSAWLGGHFPVGASAGFLVGPYVTRIDSTDDFGGGEFILGIRLGMSVYL